MVSDLAEIRRLTESKEAENVDFRRYLKHHHCLEEPFHIIAREVEAQIDCRQCANCCREMVVNVSTHEIEAIARFLGLEPSEVVRQYTMKDPADSHALMLLSDRNGCIFLDGNQCMVYDARPRACRDFPHVDGCHSTLGSRMESVCRHASVCPIIYNALEAYKRQVGWNHMTQV